MILEDIQAEYQKAYKLALKEHKELVAKGLSPYPAVLDEIIGEESTLSMVNVGLVEIPRVLSKRFPSARQSQLRCEIF